MTAQMTKSTIGGLLRKHSTDKTEAPQDFSRLPGGINDGRAQLVTAVMGEYKTGDSKGQKFVRLAAAVVEPTEVIEVKKVWDKDTINPKTKKKGVVKTVGEPKTRRVYGLQTSVMYPMCDSGKDDYFKSADDNVAEMLNMLRLVSGDDAFTADIADEDSLAEKLKMLEQVGELYVKFTTWQGEPTEKYPEPNFVSERWYGLVKDYKPPVNGQRVGKSIMEQQAAPNGNGQEQKNAAYAAAYGQAAAPPTSLQESGAAATQGEGSDLTNLLQLALAGDQEAQGQMVEIAIGAGVPEESLSATDSFQTVYDLIVQAQAGAGNEAAPTGPVVGQRGFYKISKAMKRGIEVEVVSVEESANTVRAKNLANPKMVYTIPFGRLDAQAE